MALNMVTLEGTYVDGAGTPLTGTLKFVPSASLGDSADDEVIRPKPVTVTLDGDGKFSVSLIATDNTSIAPPGWAWGVKEQIAGVPPRQWSFFLARADGATQDISDLAPVSSPVTMSSYLPLAGGTLTGPLSLPGLPTLNAQAASKQYVDTGDAAHLALPTGSATAGRAPIATGTGTATAWGPVGSITSVNTQTGPTVTLGPSDVGADASGAAAAAQTAAQSFATTAVSTHTAAEDPHGDRALAYFPSNDQIPLAPKTVITTFQAGHGFTVAGAGSSNLNDTTAGNFISGTQAVTVTTLADGATFTNLTKTGLSPIDTTNKYVMVKYRLSHAAKIKTSIDPAPATFTGPSALYVEMATDSAFANLWRWPIADLTTTLGAGYAYDNEWETLILSFADAQVIAGSPTRSGITAIRLRAKDFSEPLTVQWQEISLVDEPVNIFPDGVVTVCFDDGYLTQYTNAMPVMAPLGLRATLHIIRDALGTANELTLAQIQSLQDDLRWEVGCHADTGTVHAANDTGSLLSDVELDYRHQKSYWRQNGLTGDKTHAYPSGIWNPSVIALIKRYHQSGRLNFFRTMETFPPANPWKLRGLGAISSAGGNSAATVTAAIDAAKAGRGWLILIFHKIVTTTPAVTTECSLTDFTTIMNYLAASGMPVRTTGEVMRAACGRTAAAQPISSAGGYASGPVTLAGSPPIKLPTGTSGDVLTSDGSGNLTLAAPTGAGGSIPLVRTAVKTHADTPYAANAGDLVACDTSGGVLTVTLPTAPADKTLNAVKVVAAGSPVTIAAGGTDVFNKASGSTTLTLTRQFQTVLLEYQLSSGIWTVIATDPAIPAPTVYRQATSAITPSATVDTYGSAVTLSPDAGFTGIFPTAISYLPTSVNTGASEQLTVQSVVTWSDASTTTAASTTVANATTSLSASQMASLMASGDTKYATSIAWSVKSSIGTGAPTASTASVTVTVLGLNQ